jgi:hypothetical protein
MRPSVNRRQVLLFSFLPLLCAASVANMRAMEASSTPYCVLMADPQKFDKRVVSTEAVIQPTYHEMHVYDPECKSTVSEDRSASIQLPDQLESMKLGKKLLKLLRHDRAATVSFEALFCATGGPYGQEHTRYRFILKGLTSVRENRDKIKGLTKQ